MAKNIKFSGLQKPLIYYSSFILPKTLNLKKLILSKKHQKKAIFWLKKEIFAYL